MKKQILLILNLITITFIANAQVVFDVPPHAIPYQGVARNASGSILASQNISLRISIHDGVPAGVIVFSETHQVTTTSLGLFNLNIGTGTAVTGTLLGVNWGSSAKYIQVELDAVGGVNYVDMGTTQLNSVPYALYAGKTASLPDGGADGNTLRWTGSSWLPNDIIHNSGAYVGIGTSDPQAKLDIDGDIAMRSADININTTYNYALDLYSVKQSNYKLLRSPPIASNFVIAGIQGGVDGRIITLANRSGSPMEIYNDEPFASPAHRIVTGTGATFTVYNGGAVTLKYDVSIQKWEVINSHYNSLDYLGGGSYWDLSGTDIKNNNTGNVGIGTTPIHSRLEITGTVGSSAAMFGADKYGVNISADNPEIGFNYFYNNGTKTIKAGYGANLGMDPTNGDVYLGNFRGFQSTSDFGPITHYQQAITVKQNGNVGIDYSTPLAKLFVRKTNNTLSPEGSFAALGTTYGSYFHYGVNEDTYIRGGKDGSTVFINDGNLGNVAIGSALPESKLTIYSPPNVNATNTQLLQIRGKNPMIRLSDEFDTDRGYIKGVTNRTGTPQFAREGIEIGSGNQNSTDGDIYFTAAGYQPAMTINGLTNNVGIGTTNPTSKLSVNGNIRAKEIVVETGWADFVFDEKYKLSNLDSVETYIKLNKHLPGIPSANEIGTNGLKVGEVQTKMMEKIEELTLYVIELKKEIELLKAKK